MPYQPTRSVRLDAPATSLRAQGIEAAARHYQVRDYAAAGQCCREILTREPRNFDALHLLGVICLHRGQLAEAIEPLRKALRIRPKDARAHYHLGTVMLELKNYERAETALRRALALDPKDLGPLNNLGNALAGLQRHDEAIDCYRRLQGADAGQVHALYNMGNSLMALDRLEEAIDAYRAGLPLAAETGEASKLVDISGRLTEALAGLGRYDEALACCRALAELDPHAAAWNESLIRLLRGELAAGWKLYESRWQVAAHDPLRDGARVPALAEMAGKRVLLLAEQGHGDMIQFVRYAPLLARQGARVILQTYVELQALAREIDGLEAVVVPGDPEPQVDIMTPLLSLPFIFQTELATIPAQVPYLRLPADRLAACQQRLGRTRPRIGVAWLGSEHAAKRSLPIETLVPLLSLPGIEVHSLQKEVPPAHRAWLARHPLVRDHGKHLQDFADTAALISALDLVVSVDTSVAHLAGALAKPTWVMLPHHAEWRWLLDRDDSPWYPTARLFRQRRRGDWAGVIAEVVSALGDWLPR
jgi:Flp pilus assembly protein TadD